MISGEQLLSEFTFKAIGVIHSPFKEPKNVPIQAAASKGTEGTIEIYSQYAQGLTDLEDFSHIILLYHLHLVKDSALMVKPFLDDKLFTVYLDACTARPNRLASQWLGCSVRGNVEFVCGLDIVVGTPLLDIKPYVPAFDCVAQSGWVGLAANRQVEFTAMTGRFCK
jgi:tRNA-Thr(GGU) m(6)t(6)A37 methyltransferase TsaA